MPPPSKIDLMSPEHRAELDRRLIASAFSGSVGLSAWLGELGYEISKSTVGLHSQRLKRRLAAITASTEAMKLVAAAAPDEAEDRSNAIISLLQTDMFEALVEFQEAAANDGEDITPIERITLYGKTAKNIATLTRASVARAEWAQKAREKALLEAASRVESAAQARGLSADDAKFWREQVLMGM